MDEKWIFAQVKGFSEDGELEAVASTGALDRDSEIIDPEAWRESLEAYRKNPVILATHLHRTSTGQSPVIGSAHKIELVNGALVFRMRFSQKSALGQEYEGLYHEGHMRAFSVGFMPEDGRWQEVDRGKEGRKRVYIHTKVALWEISAVPVPSNPEALARMRAAAAAGLDERDLERLADLVAERVAAKAPKVGAVALGLPDAPGVVDVVKSEIRTLKLEILTALDTRLEEFATCLLDPFSEDATRGRPAPGSIADEDAGEALKNGAPRAAGDPATASADRLLAAMNRTQSSEG